MKKFLLLLAPVAVLVLVLNVPARSQKVNNVEKFMRVKLIHSQKILEGLTVEDFDAIAKNAQEMSLLSQAATWQVLQTPEYRQYSTEFRRSADAITAAAKKKNLDGAALAYVETTLKCISCHKYVRRVGMASLDLQDLPRVGSVELLGVNK